MSLHEGVWVFDNTELDFYRRCPRYYLYRAVHQKSGLADAIPLHFGIAVHTALEMVFKGSEFWTAIESAVTYFAPFDNGADLKRSVGTLRHILTHYFAYYTPETFTPITGMVEIGFAVELSPSVMYTGRLDAFGTLNGYRGKWLMDHKTAWRVDDYQLKPHNQFTGYIYAGKQYFEDMDGLVANLVLVAKDACTMKKRGEEEYLKGKAPEDCFFRTTTQRTPAELEAWRVETLYLVEQIKRSLDDNRWPQNTTYGCKAFNHQCEFYPVCIQPTEGEQLELLNSPLYKSNPWEPYVGEEETNQTRTDTATNDVVGMSDLELNIMTI